MRKTGLIAISLQEDDELIEVKTTDGHKDVLLVTKFGQCIRFNEKDVRSTGRNSMGVIGMNLAASDEVVGMQLNTQGEMLLAVSEKGMGKCTMMDEFTVQNRGGKGVKCYKITEKTGNIIGVKAVNKDNEIMMITTEGIIIRMPVKGISVLTRVTSGVKLMNLESDVKVASLTKVREAEPKDEVEEDDLALEKEADTVIPSDSSMGAQVENIKESEAGELSENSVAEESVESNIENEKKMQAEMNIESSDAGDLVIDSEMLDLQEKAQIDELLTRAKADQQENDDE